MPRPNSILIPYSTSLNLIKGRKYLLNRQLIYTGASIYLSFKKFSRSYRGIIRDPSLRYRPIGQIIIAFRLLVQALQLVQRYRELSSIVLNYLSQALQLSYSALLIRDSISVDISSYSACLFTAQVLVQFTKRIQGSANSVQEEDFKGNR